MTSFLYKIFGPIVVYAQDAIVPVQCQQGEPCDLCCLGEAVKNATDIMIALAGPLAVVFLIWGGVVFMTSGGSQERVSTAKKVATSAIVGLIIVLVSWVLVNTIINFMVSTEGGGWLRLNPLSELPCDC